MLLNGDITVYDENDRMQICGVRICDKTSLKISEKAVAKSGSLIIRIFKDEADVKEGAKIVIGKCEDEICPAGAFLVTAVKKNKGICKTHYKVIAER